MKFLLYTKVNEATVKESLGLPEYSYFFVFKEFKSIFAELGDIVEVHSREEIVEQGRISIADKTDFIVVLFCPPHVAPDVHPYKAFCVLAWEFDTIPNECWDDDPRNDWRYVLNRHVGLICLSSHTRSTIKRVMGADYLVEDIAVPVWDKYLLHNPITDERESIDHSLMLEIDGSVIDSKNYLITDDKFEIINAADYFKVSPWAGETLHYNFSHHHPDSALLGGFYHAEGWGIWSRMATPWLFLETQISGAFKVAFRARGFGATVGKIVTIEIGGVTQSFELAAESTAYVLKFLNVSPCNIIRFVGLDLTPPGYDYDSRSMALGLENMSITDLSNIEIAQLRPSNPVKLRVDGVVYTSVFNPVDARKNWEDIVSAFCYAHADNARATLILKVTHLNLSSIMGRLHFLLQKIGRVDCRVIAIQGFLPDDNFNQLIKNTSFYVNASSAEGLCLPLLEFMAAGVPAIAPKHTAMEDYIDEYSSFVVDTSKEPTIWPHDPRGLKRATSNRINWSSLATQFQETFDCAMSAPEQYLIKSVASRENVKKCTEGSMIKYKLDNFLNKI